MLVKIFVLSVSIIKYDFFFLFLFLLSTSCTGTKRSFFFSFGTTLKLVNGSKLKVILADYVENENGIYGKG
jgi:hypothetical protein